MGTGPTPAVNRGSSSSVGVEDNFGGLFGSPKERREEHKRQISNLFNGFANLPIIGVIGAGGTRKTYPVETLNSDMRGQGAEKGLPTADENGVVNLVYRQVCHVLKVCDYPTKANVFPFRSTKTVLDL